MKKVFIITSIILIFVSCSKKEENKFPDTGIKNNLLKTYTSIFLTGCVDETWDGDINHDCSGDPTNCVVICEEVSTNLSYPDFQQAVINGTIADFYQNGYGQNVLPVTSEEYNSIVNGTKTIYKITASDVDKYALY